MPGYRTYQVAITEAHRFIVDALRAAGANCVPAMQQADMLLAADKLGHPSHGMNRLEYYVSDIQSGSCEPNNRPEILKESAATAWIDAKNVLGATSSNIAMDKAIEKAIDVGVGWVTVKGGNHNGICGYWARKAACQGMIGVAYTNTPPIMAPTRSKEASLGTNPIAVAAVGSDNELFYLDMATTAVALGKVEMQMRRNEPLGNGWAQGPDGYETTDAKLAFKTKRLFPLGGLEKNGGYKGFGLAAMVDVFTGITSGSKYGHHIEDWTLKSTGEPRDWGQCFVAVNPEFFAPGFCDRLTDSIQHWRSLEPLDPNYPVMAPGDLERMAEIKADKTGLLTYVQSQINTCATIAKKLNLKPMIASEYN